MADLPVYGGKAKLGWTTGIDDITGIFVVLKPLIPPTEL
jgi:hypothetical protein